MIVYFLLVLFNSALSQYQEIGGKDGKLRVMTINIWRSGGKVENGLSKVSKHIQRLNPDIVALQEIGGGYSAHIVKLLGSEWSFVETGVSTSILTKHQIVPDTLIKIGAGFGCRIMLKNGRYVNFWSTHLDWRNYGPYAAFFKKSVTNTDQILAGEKSRTGQIIRILESPELKNWISKSTEIPIIFCGDFNTPSHLDWTDDTKQFHNGWIVEWPTTKKMSDYGFIDSFRKVHPSAKETPGWTWSTVQKMTDWNNTLPEPQDRLDFIFYRGPIVPLLSEMYGGNETLVPMPNHEKNDYPSDHYAVFTDFSFE